MKTLSALLVILLLGCGCSKKESSEAKGPNVDQPSNSGGTRIKFVEADFTVSFE